MRTHPKIALTVVAAAALALCAILWARLGPIPATLLDGERDRSTTVVDRYGVVLYESRARDGTRGTWLAEDALPENLVLATLAAEDRRFFRHYGVDPIAIVRAALRNIREGAAIEGGSTLTQQAAKLLLTRQREGERSARGISTKIRESLLAFRLEHRLSKRQILALYLNLAPYGNQIHGAERASRAYFGAPASQLTPAQAAFLAGLPQRPSRFNPFRHTSTAIARQRRVIDRMEAQGALSSAAAAEARSERLVLKTDDSILVAPHFVEMVLSADKDRRLARIETTLDAALQREVQGIIRRQRDALVRHNANNVAVVVLDNARGEWLAWEGSGDYFDSEHGGTINGPMALRQPGSALKPFTYALAFEEGRSPATALADVPSHFPTAEPGIVYSPRNYDGRYRGPLLARRALAGSENVPAVALASEIGVPKLIRFLRSAGLSTFDKTAAHYGLGVTLGNAEVRLAELVGAYAAFARDGMRLQPSSIRGVDRRPARLLSARSAFWITDVLSDPEAREYAFGRGGSLDFPFPVAAKTGTSEGYHDNWALGYTREVTVGVWVGNFDRAPLRNSSGITGAGPVFHAVMLAAQKRAVGSPATAGAPLTTVPHDLERQSICSLSGLRANAWCPSRTGEWLAAASPSMPCSWHHTSEDGTVVIWPQVYRQWARAHEQNRDMAARPPEGTNTAVARIRAANTSSTINRPFVITNPPQGATYLIDPTLRMKFQTLALRASADMNAGRIAWSVDGRPVGSADADTPLHWALTPGEHQISAVDTRGRVDETSIIVK